MNTETKELLELAAKAMGFELYYGYDGSEQGPCRIVDGDPESWDPLTSGDDLVEMECQIEVDVSWDPKTVEAYYWREFRDPEIRIKEHFKNHPSRRAARAMASLRVVAEIGRRMETRE